MMTQYIFIFLVSLLMFLFGLRIQKYQLQQTMKAPMLLGLGLLIYAVIWPLVVLGLCYFFKLQTEVSLALVLIATTPAGATGSMLANLGGGDSELSLTLMALYGVLGVFFIPVFLILAQNIFTGSNVGFVNLVWLPVLIMIMFFPAIIGAWLREKRLDLVVRSEKVCKKLSSFIIFLMILVVVFQERRSFSQTSLSMVLIMTAICLLSILITFMLVFFKGTLSQSISISMGVSNPNCGLALALAVNPAIYPVYTIAFPVVIYSGIALVMGLISSTIFARITNRAIP